MDESLPPDQLRTAAVVQLVVGLIDLTVGVFLTTTMTGLLGCLVTSPCMCLGLPSPGILCGMLGFLVYPIGLIEVAAGVVGLANPKGGATLMKVAAIMGLCGVFIGSITSAIGGGIAMMQLSSPQVKAWLEGPQGS